ncbi:ribosome hibernation-promoting factor, HPF/YfiA family [Rufibacter roseus]|uniref:Ribosome hibernation-promoting factor, HPF/YfiA family n=1 Tax=Rufibacter roseus TaxID=1567108 RepID=A0ABW2DUA7_9BACT|nr:ribosome-associated translation inhibitor RaiA [Rufibacter roseus]
MNYTENFEGIRIDVQAVDITITDGLQQRVRDAITKMKRFVHDINWVDVYFKVEPNHATNTKTVSMKLGIPGEDVFASESGDEWFPIMNSIEDKLRKQLEKR